MNPCVSGASTNNKRTSNKTSISMGKNQSANNPKKFPIDEDNVTQMQNQKAVVLHTIDRVGLAQSVACPPLARLVVSSPLGRVIPKTIIKKGTNCLPA